MSLLGFLLMGYDKYQAKSRKQRIPESLFFTVSLLLGTLGIIIGGLIFSHKTSKRSFQLKILLSFIIQLALLYIYYQI